MRDLSIVMYHYVRPIKDSAYPDLKGLELELFRQQIDYFEKEFHVVTMEQVIDAVSGKGTLPEKAMLLTFDDGYIDHYQYVFPILKEHHMQGSFFVPSALVHTPRVLDVNKIHFILVSAPIEEVLLALYEILNRYRSHGVQLESNEVLFEKLAHANRWDTKEVIFVKRMLQSYLDEDIRGKIVTELFHKFVTDSDETFSNSLYMNKAQIIEMKQAGMYFGLHGEKHYWLNQVSEEKMKRDILNGLEFFKDVIDPDYMAINYPYGGYNETVVEFAKSIGCKVGFSVEARHVDFIKENPLLLPRLDTNDFPPKSERWREL